MYIIQLAGDQKAFKEIAAFLIPQPARPRNVIPTFPVKVGNPGDWLTNWI